MDEDFLKNEELKEFGEIEKETPLWKKAGWRFLIILVSILVIIGLIYFSGLKQYFFYRKTPTNTRVEEMESVLKAETITVPVVARILRAEDSNDGSARSKENIKELVNKTNKIWTQADIELNLLEVEIILMDEEEINQFSDSPYKFTRDLENFNENLVNVFFIGNLEGPSGLAYMGTGNILVADYTTSDDYLVFAHEIGHVFSLTHTGSSHKSLMNSEAKSPVLSEPEIIRAREAAEEFSKAN